MASFNETIANLGYVALVKETTAGTPLTPTDWVPYYKETMTTNINLIKDNPIAGINFDTYNIVQGQRDHKGDIEFYYEPNTAARLTDAFLVRTSTTGGGPYTHVFGLSTATVPNSYTIDISYNNVVHRFYGCQVSKIVPTWDANETRLTASISALGSFTPRQITSVTGAGPYTVTLDTTYDPSPTTGLVVGDLIRFYHAATNVTTDATVATVTSGTVFTTVTNPTPSTAADVVYLRPATPTFTLLTPFLWAKTQFCFGANAAAALSATQTRVDIGSTWELDYNFEDDKGSWRSGGFDPAALIRTQGAANLKLKKYFNNPNDVQNWSMINKTACVIRMYSGSTNQYEYRVTFNNLKIGAGVLPDGESAKVLYAEEDLYPQYDSSDAQAIGVTVINNLATI